MTDNQLQLALESGATPTPGKGDEDAERSSCKINSKLQRITSPRQIRTLRALLGDDIRRERLDQVAGASNSPDVVASLRRRGLRIDCDTSKPVTDRDGRKAYPGIYSLHPDDRAKAIDLINSSEVAR